VPLVHTDIPELLASDCHVIHVLLPPHLHVDVTRRILEAGKSAFVEKPMGLGSAQCQQLVDLAKSRGLKLGVNHNFLFLPSYERLREELRDGTLGPIDHVTVNWLYMLGLLQFGPFNNWMLREEGNLVYELGPHLAAFVVDLLGPVEDLVGGRLAPDRSGPGRQRVWRHWNAIGAPVPVGFAFNSRSPPANRNAACKCGATPARPPDFERDFYRRQTTSSTSAVFDPFLTRCASARLLAAQRSGISSRPCAGTLAKSSTSNVFQESIQRSGPRPSTVASWGARPAHRRRLRCRGDALVRTDRRTGRWCCNAGAAASTASAVRTGRREARRRCSWSVPAPASSASAWSGARRCAARRVRVLSRSNRVGQLELDGLPVHIEQARTTIPTALARCPRRHRGRLPPRQRPPASAGRLRQERGRADAGTGRSSAGPRRPALHLHRHDRLLRLRDARKVIDGTGRR
jgi:hypothetical protein